MNKKRPNPAWTEELRLTGVVAELAGLLAGVNPGDVKEEYINYLVRKYS